MLEFMEKSYPDLVKEVTRLIPLQKLTDIYKRLVQEQISVKDLRSVFEALSEWAQSEKDTVLLTEYVRSSLKRYISYKYSQGQSVLSVYILDPEIEDMVRGAIKQTSAGSYLALDPDSVQLILQGIRNTIAPPPPGGQAPVLLTAILWCSFDDKDCFSVYLLSPCRLQTHLDPRLYAMATNTHFTFAAE